VALQLVKNALNPNSTMRSVLAYVCHTRHWVAKMAHRAKPQKRLPPHSYYVQRCILYSISGRWPLPFAERWAMYARENAVNTGYSGKGTNKLRRDWGTYDRPMEPASSLPDSHALSAQRFLERRGWTLVKNIEGHWQLQRLANF